MYCPAIRGVVEGGEGGALFSRCSLLPVIRSPSEREQLTVQKYEETQISSINRTDNISYATAVCVCVCVRVCVFFCSAAQTRAHFSAPSLITRGDLRRVTQVPTERRWRAARCLWKKPGRLFSLHPTNQPRPRLSTLYGIPVISGRGEGKGGEFPTFLSIFLLVSFTLSLPLFS